MLLPRVTNITRERIARELDDIGPEFCVQGTLRDLRRDNSELLDIVEKCAASFGDRQQDVLRDLCIFYRLLATEFRSMDRAFRLLNPLPRVTRETRDRLVREIDALGVDAFVTSTVREMAQDNPELLQMAHRAAERQPTYLPLMQGFALLYRALSEQAKAGSSPGALH